MDEFILESQFKPTGDQPQAIEKLVSGLNNGLKDQVLLGVTGSGKTFTMANVIRDYKRPTLVISHNKTLAAQLAQEYREFFPNNAVGYFVSYYDYYQPEAYIPQRDQYIEKEANINTEVDKLRLAATASLLERQDVIIVASVSCIYNLGSPLEYGRSAIRLTTDPGKSEVTRDDFLKSLINLFYTRSDYEFSRSTFRVRGDHVDVYPSYTDEALRVSFNNNGRVYSLSKISPVTGNIKENLSNFVIYPAKHYITAKNIYDQATTQIKADLEIRMAQFKKQGKILEAHRLNERTKYDLEMIKSTGYCNGIENYSRYFDGRNPGDPPFTLLDFFPKDLLMIIDESHITVPQIRGMYNGDKARKETLINYGFRLPSAFDNRPLRFDEFARRIHRVIYTSATPDQWEVNRASRVTGGVVEQLIRPTGLLDPEIEIRGIEGQIEDLIKEIELRVSQKERVLVTTLTKRLSEELTAYLSDKGIRVQYLHSDVETLVRSDILDDLRSGKYDVLVGINLLREGLDLPEVSLVAILDADKEGFLRSCTSLIQTMGRAARHVHGKVIMYADNITGSMRRAMDEVDRRRKVQEEYNRQYHVIPRSIEKPIRKRLVEKEAIDDYSQGKGIKAADFVKMPHSERISYINDLENNMKEAAAILDFELASKYRDKIRSLKKLL